MADTRPVPRDPHKESRRQFLLDTTKMVCGVGAAGLGLALVFRGEADDDRRLRAVTIDDGRHRAGFYLVTLPENLQIPSVEAFVGLAHNGK